jgi:adenylyltransferase/sulfurtransferase
MVPSCAEGGVLGVLPGIIGSLQALEVIKLIIGQGDPLIGRLVLFDALSLEFRELKIRKNPDCPVCGENPTVTELIDYLEFCGMPAYEEGPWTEDQTGIPTITATELSERLQRGDALRLLDVREPHEWEIVNLGPQGAQLIPLDQLIERLSELDTAEEIVLHCQAGGRSAKALRQLQEAGFRKLWNLKGGILAWQKDVDPSLPRY